MASKLGLVAHTCNPSRGEAKAGGSSRAKASLGYTTSLFHHLKPRSFLSKMALKYSKLPEEEVVRYGCIDMSQKCCLKSLWIQSLEGNDSQMPQKRQRSSPHRGQLAGRNYLESSLVDLGFGRENISANSGRDTGLITGC